MDDQNEIWKSIPDFPNYEVSNFGRVRNATTLHVYKLCVNSKTGYTQLTARKAGSTKKTYSLKIHRTVYQSFIGAIPETIGAIPETFEIDHIDRNRTNNRLDNLRICSRSENAHRAIKVNVLKYRGVYALTARKKKYFSRVVKDKIFYHLGYFDDAAQAASAYNAKALELFGEFAELNEIP